MLTRRGDDGRRRFSNHATNTSVTIQITDESDRTSINLDRNDALSENLEGNFQHYKKKVKQIHFEELAQPPEPFFHVDVGANFDSYFRGQRVRFKEKKAEHFASVVDLDAYEYHKVVFHSFLDEILQSVYFRSLILFLVMLNAVMIGVQTFPSVTSNAQIEAIFTIVDQIILSVFIFEIILKWMYDFRLFWKVTWNVMDISIIFLVISSSVLPFGGGGNGRALVTVRVIRAFRSLRSVSSMASLSIVVQTIFKSGKDMGNIILVLIIFMLVLSVMGVILFDLDEINLPNFINGLDSWYTVFICVTQDGWADLLEQFLNFGGPNSPNKYDKYLVIYLLIAVSAGGFVFANLIVAVIVTNLELAVKEFRDEKAMSDNPLDFHSDRLSSEIDVLPVHELLAQNNTALIAQRPFKIPSLKKVSLRRLQAYIALIVALEHNVLEAEIIQMDLEKVMAVLVSTMAQLEIFKSRNQLESERKHAIMEFNKYAAAVSIIPMDKVNQIEALSQLQKMKHHQSAGGQKDSISRDSVTTPATKVNDA